MPSTPYAPLPTQPTQEDADRDLQDAFGEDDDDEDALESTRLINQNYQPGGYPFFHQNRPQPIQIPGTYDFERDYDYTMPPPGSPPRPSATALPNDYGNTNGLIPTSPVTTPLRSGQSSGGFSVFFRKAVGSILPTHYQTLPTASPTPRVVGGGLQNDGVFANVMAKPVSSARTVTEDGGIFLAPETTQSQAPPSYAEAQTDAVPPYWETTVVTPLEPGEVIVDDLPTGSVLVFAFNLFTSFFFQFLGFVITYFLSTTHAARYGSRAGLGLTLIQYGAYWRAAQNIEASPSRGEQQEITWWNETMTGIGSGTNSAIAPNSTTLLDLLVVQNSTGTGEVYYGDFGFRGKDWFALFFMTFGWVLLFTSIVGFWRVKRWEMSIRASSHPQAPVTASDLAREVQVRRNIESIFGFGEDRELETAVDPQAEAEIRLARHLRAAGLI
ncbi:hypothetical protein BDM02DRAFT_735818 [Thelephora ganbajun]|uniref:Uncharacterized protein n=1 Tax=Thelephora ganbajun TaxID=370292 RepID=A0ACB6ZP73_THEGA|nr:hypothetical protein BDM02DRAFT_735818 [Thelephora ganbajun]